jgi:hypothetical protein
MATGTRNNGAERVSRRRKQAANAEQAKQEALLVPPKGSAKAAAAEATKQTELARFGGAAGTTRKRAQVAHAQQADKEAAQLAAAPDPVLGNLEPGDTPTPRQLRLLAKQHQRPIADEATDVGREAGRMVRDAILGRRNLRHTPHTRHRVVAEAQSALQRQSASR